MNIVLSTKDKKNLIIMDTQVQTTLNIQKNYEKKCLQIKVSDGEELFPIYCLNTIESLTALRDFANDAINDFKGVEKK